MKFAFLILEPKRSDASKTVRHVLCAQSEEDREDWRNALVYYIELDPEPATITQVSTEKSRAKRTQRRFVRDPGYEDSTSDIQTEQNTISIRYDQTAIQQRPSTATGDANRDSTWSQASQDDIIPRGVDNRAFRQSELRTEVRQPAPTIPSRSPYRGAISGPMNGATIRDDAAWSSAQREEEQRREEKRVKKRSMWGFLSKGRTFQLPSLIYR